MAGEEKRLGSILIGRYEILSIIQKGGMGTVFLGRHLELDKDVAIKIFHPHLTEKKEMVARFVNEARGVAKLHHRNIVSVFDIGADEEGIPFFVMEYLKGESLRERLKKIDALSVKASTDIMIQILSGLRVAHKKNIVHRDLKPGNIFLSREEDGSEVVKILDFGVAKFREMDPEKQGEITTDGSILGTPSYMSPEQATGKKNVVDPRSDLYSCGIMLYRCLTGLNVFKGDSPLETIQNIVSLEPPPPSFFNEAIPKEIDEVVLRAIQRDRNKRYQDCETFIEDLKRFYSLAGTSPGDLVAKIVAGESGSEESGDHSTVSQIVVDVDHSLPSLSHGDRTQKKPAGMRRGLWALMVITLVVAGGLVLGWSLFFKNRNKAAGDGTKLGLAADVAVEKEVAAPEEDAVGPPETKQQVDIELVGLVPGATVLVNGEKVEGSSFNLEKSETPAIVAISYEGEIVFEKAIKPVQDEMIYVDIAAEKEAPGEKGKSGKKKGGGKPKEKVEGSEEKPPEKKPKEKVEEDKPPTKIFKDFD